MYIPKRREKKTMTRFEREYREAQQDADLGIIILRERKAELQEIERKGRSEKNGFRRECLAQEFVKLQREYAAIEELV